MSGHYPYPRFYRIKENNRPLFLARAFISRAKRRFWENWQKFERTYLGGERRWLDKKFPYRPYSSETGKPIVENERLAGCRTKHGLTRQAELHPTLREKHLASEMLLYEEDDEEWIKALSSEEKDTLSAELVVRVLKLAETGRITKKEFNELLDRKW